LGIAFDISDQKEAEEKLQEANSRLEMRVAQRTAELEALNQDLESRVAARTFELDEKNAELKQLTHVATHDLKVPINNLCSLTHILSEAEPLLPEEHVETLGWMRQVSAQARDKLDTLVWVAQLQDRKLPPFDRIDMAELTEAALVSQHFDMQQARAVVTSDFSAVRYLRFLSQEFENMVESLVSNAIRYAHAERRPRVEIRSDLDGGDVVLRVSDNGRGLNLPRDEAKVFGLFQRAHSVPEGTGVALYAIRRIMEKLDGQISVESNPTEGCTFALRFPGSMRCSA
jgi:light-regulated signal transduction histidine kinase (bacteriophytochrome)